MTSLQTGYLKMVNGNPLDSYSRQKLALRVASEVSDLARFGMGDDRAQLLFCILTDYLSTSASDDVLLSLSNGESVNVGA